jgi:hypothetical protein
MKPSPWRKPGLAFLLQVLTASALVAQIPPVVPNGSTVENWTVPPYHRESASRGLSPMTDISPAGAFVAMIPCRVFDTRNPNGPYGGPRLVANVARNFDIDNGPCIGIPGTFAYSMNFGAILPDGQGFITIWPTGEARPLVSAINTIVGQVVANAAIVPTGANGAISVFANTGVHLYGDINGYFLGALNPGNSLYITSTSVDPAMVGINTSGTNGSNAINGINSGSGCACSGVTGRTSSVSNGSAGVYGYDGSATVSGSYIAAGVRGDSASSGIGVFGLTEVGGSGVAGYRTNGGSLLAGAELGFTSTTALQAFGNFVATGTKSFVEPHPTDASKMIRYISLEGNESGTYFRGRGKFENGLARIPVPEDFRIVTDPEGLTVQITPIGAMASYAVLRADLNEVVVQSSRSIEFYYLVQGVRRAYKDSGPIVENEKVFVPRSPDEPMPAYLPEALRLRLISNGTYRPDGTVNMDTARRLGWDRTWEQHSRPAPEPTP